MKFSQVLTSVALAAAMASASAATVTINGSSTPFALLASSATINFSNDATALDSTNPNFSTGSSVISAFGVASIALSPSGAATIHKGSVDYTDYSPLIDDPTADPVTGLHANTIGIEAGVTQLTASMVGTVATIGSVSSSGGVTQTAAASAVSNGGFVTIQNLRVDFSTSVNGVYSIYGDVSGIGTKADGTTPNPLTATNKAVFTFTMDNVDGPTSFDVASLAPGASATLTTRIKHLGMTASARADLVKGLSLKSGLGQNTLQGLTDFGYIDSVITIKNMTPAVPEPSTYALMIAGLGAVGMMARRRAAR